MCKFQISISICRGNCWRLSPIRAPIIFWKISSAEFRKSWDRRNGCRCWRSWGYSTIRRPSWSAAVHWKLWLTTWQRRWHTRRMSGTWWFYGTILESNGPTTPRYRKIPSEFFEPSLTLPNFLCRPISIGKSRNHTGRVRWAKRIHRHG